MNSGRAVQEPATAVRPAGLDAVFRPRSIAVIGASRERGTVGAEIFHNLLEHGFQGPVYPVNPKADVVQSVHAYSAIEEIEGDVDLAVVVVPALRVNDIVEACGRKGVRAVVVISAGFKETGAEGRERERRLLELARRYGMRVVGPNCLGVLNTEAGVRLDATFAPTFPPPGSVAFSSQSGALGLAILELAAKLGIGISHFISVGNKADVSGNDLIEYWESDAGTRTILLYLESFGNPRKFLQIARRVARQKPIVAVKSGRTRAGMRAASSHTGSLAGADTAVSALCEQAGVIRTDTIEELFDVAMLLANQPVPRGPRVGIVTNAGGPGIMASDACETSGLEVVTLEESTVSALRDFLPAEASTRNPVDMIASATPESFEKAVRLVANDPNVDAVVVLYVPPIVTRPLEVAQAIVRGNEAAIADASASGRPPKPVLSCFLGSHGVPEGLRSLQEAHIPSYGFPESAAIALARAVRYGRWRETPEGRVRRFDDVDVAVARAALAGASHAGGNDARWLAPEAVRALLEAYRIPSPATVLAATPDAAARAAEQVGYPVALKLASETITHKSDVGGVVLDVRRAEEAVHAFERMARQLEKQGRRAEMQGVTVQPMLRGGVEAVIGMTRDASFGPLLMFGLGGTQVELLKDVVFRVHPLSDRDAAEMVRRIKGARLFDGYRGAPPSDVGALEEMLMRVSQMVGDHPEIVEMDLNPVSVRERGQGCIVLDARIAVHAAPATAKP
ncbi:MAG TPA: acetate--CoA ligase family protein [Candidatus Eisenbacteria bacterium]|nr:acetate--CoA ligase family protein [Candidatus Eisenbacteria bacterium]